MSIEIKETFQERTHLEDFLQRKVKEKRYLSAIKLAQTLKLPQEKIRNLQELALRQIALEYRNAAAVRNLAREWGFARADLENLLYAGLAEYEELSGKKHLEQAYDIATGKYLTLRQWVDQFLNARNK